MAVAFAEVKDQVEARGVAIETIQWYYDNEKISMDGDLYAGNCMVCRQYHKNPDPAVIVNVLEGCRTMHVHDKGVTF